MRDAAMLTLAYILDLAIGDPRHMPHPVRVMGWGIEKMEKLLRSLILFITRYSLLVTRYSLLEKIAGTLLVIVIVCATYGLFYAVNSLFTIHYSLFTALFMIYLTSTTVATHELIKSAKRVIRSLNADNIYEARENLSHIVGRDTKSLDSKGITKAVIETLAENASDGIIAPLFYFAIGGLPLAMTYKAINTLDSMVGYKNEEYRNFGWAGARLDDVANYIPARITGILIFISTFIVSCLNRLNSSSRLNCLNCLNAFKIMRRDGRNHLSPNSGVPEAAMAGALGIRLGGPSLYGGIMVEKPFIGEERQSTEHGQGTEAQGHRAQTTIVRREALGENIECRAQNIEKRYLEAADNAIAIIKFTSFFGLIFVLAILMIKGTL